MLEVTTESSGGEMGRILRSSLDSRQVRKGDTRRLVAAALGVWALLLQSMLPVAGAIASETGNGFLIELCTTAGVQTIDAGQEEGSPERPLQSKTSSGCDLCVGCGCSRGAGACGAMAALPSASSLSAVWPLEPLAGHHVERAAAFQSRAPPAA